MRSQDLVYLFCLTLSCLYAGEPRPIIYQELSSDNILAIKRCDKLISHEFFWIITKKY